MSEARERFDRQIQAAFAEMKAFLAGRSPRTLTGPDAVTFMALRARFDALAVMQKRHAEAALWHRLDPNEGSETVDA